MRAFVTGRSQRHHVGEEISLRCVLDILEWGNTGLWKDVPLKTKGDIFARKFVRGVRTLHMISYKQVNVYVLLVCNYRMTDEWVY